MTRLQLIVPWVAVNATSLGVPTPSAPEEFRRQTPGSAAISRAS